MTDIVLFFSFIWGGALPHSSPTSKDMAMICDSEIKFRFNPEFTAPLWAAAKGGKECRKGLNHSGNMISLTTATRKSLRNHEIQL